MADDGADLDHSRACVAWALDALGQSAFLVNDAAYQGGSGRLEVITGEKRKRAIGVNTFTMLHLARAAVPNREADASLIDTKSIQAGNAAPAMLLHGSARGAPSNSTAGLAKMPGERDTRCNAFTRSPLFTPLTYPSMSEELVTAFCGSMPGGRAGQPAELAGARSLPASGSSVDVGALLVTDSRPML